MCAINPKHQARFELNVYTAHGTAEEFKEAIDKQVSYLLEVEQNLNAMGNLRWHIARKDKHALGENT